MSGGEPGEGNNTNRKNTHLYKNKQTTEGMLN